MNAPLLPDMGDGKDPGAFRTIGEVAKTLGIRQHVLRYWEEQFPMLRPLTRAGGRRYYRPEDIALIAEIDRLLNREGYTIRGAKQALKVRGKRAGTAVREDAVELTSSASGVAVQAVAGLVQSLAATDFASLAAELGGIRERLAVAIEDDAG
ncbi:transcriptional regulator, MerR family [Novosphingobium aromaticivorans DSM 12444]|uniref:Transcriptional regulator, MerR family n=1 Tax=Novosphingobium aromaticivorans (strain ATCC 700278 / DSM 12444 / CCUG 56034 / CIP 105152 / NBRC 16084 / F199) TaxID=279238 RepID=Q2G5S3_NOVAD|nr:MerR family transcriptional regulator [Novosphingobium aromaticivorans]ABD26800.1 transcriptional regulator, MerR family [Novosphingobium aromaticivorans DSM 12444]SCY42488.1 transcriptional regulator, MerR family [Novosphingobium aromaticivorans]